MIGIHTVTVADVDISCLVIDVTIQHGRESADSQPVASAVTLNIEPTALDPIPAALEIGAIITVTTVSSTATDSIRFVGAVTDINLGWEDAGELTPDSGTGQIVATSALADLGRRVVGDTPWPQELDGARVNRIMAAAGVTLDPEFSDPGTVEILARDVDSQAALQLAQDVANDAAGIVWATRAGEIRYADAAHRRGTTPALTLDACQILVTPTWRRTTEGLINYVSIGYGETPEGEEGEQPRAIASNPSSQARYGRYEYTAGTQLAATADAEAMAQLLMVRNSSPVWIMAALPIDVAGLTDADYDALLGLDVGDLLVLTGLPAIGAAPTSASLWVEGWREELAFDSHALEIVVSGYCRTAPPPRWDDISPTWTWDNTPSNLTWDDATCIGPPVSFGRWADVPASLRWDQVAPDISWDEWGTGIQ